MIATKLGRPIMLDAYTSTICLKSWGRHSYAQVLIEVSSENAFVESIVVAIPFLNGLGHTMETIDVEFEWKPPRCDTCKIFMHNDNQCPKAAKVAGPIKASDDRFVKVTRKHRKGKQPYRPRHIDGVCLTKPKPNYYYRPISKLDATLNSKVNGETSTSQPKDNKEAYISQHKHNSKKSLPLEEVNFVSSKKSFVALKDKEDIFGINDETWRNTNDIRSLKHDNDSEEVENVFVENATFMGGKINTKKVEVPLKKTGI
ncbi:hypothetical protein Tco_0606815 [Tanacetum coccineum]